MENLQKNSQRKEQKHEAERAGYNDTSHASDAMLIQGIAAQDQRALENLYHRYYRNLYRFISHITGPSGCVGDTVNDVMYLVWDTAAQFSHGTRSTTWIYGIACNEALKSLVRQGGLQDPGERESMTELCESVQFANLIETIRCR